MHPPEGAAAVSLLANVPAPTPAGEPWLSAAFTIAPEHPALAGHFPGNPVVPGVLLLQRVLGLVAGHLGSGWRLTVTDAKFVQPLVPGEPCRIALRRLPPQRITFECHVRCGLVARGSLSLESDA